MPQLKALMKRDVQARDIGRSIGRPADILVDPTNHQVSLIVMTEGAIPELSVVIPAEAIASFDVDALSIASLTAVHLAVHDRTLLSKLEGGLKLRRRSVFTAEGRRLGRIDGIEVDAQGGVVTYRVRKPRFGLIRPRLELKPSEVSGLGAEFAVADPEQTPTDQPESSDAKASAP